MLRNVRHNIFSDGRCAGGQGLLSDMAILLRHKKPQLLAAYTDILGYDVEAIHGPIEEWFFFGSEMTYEMPITTFFGYESTDLIVLLKK